MPLWHRHGHVYLCLHLYVCYVKEFRDDPCFTVESGPCFEFLRLLGYCAAWGCFLKLTFRDNASVPFSRVKLYNLGHFDPWRFDWQVVPKRRFKTTSHRLITLKTEELNSTAAEADDLTWSVFCCPQYAWISHRCANTGSFESRA